jgi:adenylate cyclase
MVLRGDDPCLAIELAVRLVDDLGASDALPPVRVGVHSGTAVFRNGDWYGSAVNVASRLCSAAGGSEVLVSEDAYRAAGDLDGLTLGERRLHWLKNVPEPIGARVASAQRERTSLSERLRLKAKRRRSPICPPTPEVAV